MFMKYLLVFREFSIILCNELASPRVGKEWKNACWQPLHGRSFQYIILFNLESLGVRCIHFTFTDEETEEWTKYSFLFLTLPWFLPILFLKSLGSHCKQWHQEAIIPSPFALLIGVLLPLRQGRNWVPGSGAKPGTASAPMVPSAGCHYPVRDLPSHMWQYWLEPMRWKYL